MAEQVYFSDRVVRVTGSYAQFGQRSFSLSDIERVKIEPRLPEDSWAYRRALDQFYVSATLSIIRLYLDLPTNDRLAIALGIGSIYAALFGLLILCLWLSGSRYMVRIAGRFGDVYVVRARHLMYAWRVALALRRARRESRKRKFSLA